MSLLNPKRAQTKLIVSMSPGIHLRKLQRLLGASFTTTRYHVGNLERDGEIVRWKDGRYDRLYPAGTAEGMKEVYSVLQSKTARRILQSLSDGGGQDMTNGDLSDKLHISRSTLSEYVAHLCKAGLLRRSLAADGRILFGVEDAQELSRILAVFEKNMLSIATDRFVDLWDI